jgi:hypothetical protein
MLMTARDMIVGFMPGRDNDSKMINCILDEITTPTERTLVCVSGNSEKKTKLNEDKYSLIAGKYIYFKESFVKNHIDLFSSLTNSIMYYP